MTITSLQQSSNALSAIYGIANSQEQINNSTIRLSTGNRFARASDDIAALSISSRLQSNLSGLRQAQTNASQADSLLQVAYGGLQEINDILDEMKTLSVSATSGTLTTADRALLDLEFQELRSEIDRLADNTAFGDIKLIDGSVSGTNEIADTSTDATQAQISLTFTANVGAGETVIINGTTFTEGTDFTAGASTNLSVQDLTDQLNLSTDTNISQASYQAVGSAIVATLKTGGAFGNQFTADTAGTATYGVAGDATDDATIFSASGGTNDGLYKGGVSVSGNINDTLVDAQSQVKGTVRIDATTININDTIQIDDGDAGTTTFTFVAAPANETQILLGSSVSESLKNAADTISQYSAAQNFVTRQLDFVVDDNSLTFVNKVAGNATDLNGGAPNFVQGLTAGSISAATMTNGVNSGVNTTGLMNPDFIGTISGFSATFNGADDITASITVGSDTYSADITDTTPAADGVVRFQSTSGGYFDVELNGGAGATVSDQSDADTYASRLDTAFSGLNFYQTRLASSFTGTGDLAGAFVEFTLDDFSDVQIDDISVTAPTGSATDAIIEFDVDGEIFRSNEGIGTSISPNEQITFTSLTDGNRQIRLTNGTQTVSITDATEAAALQSRFVNDFALGTGTDGISFRVGTDATDTISVSINSANSSDLFDNNNPSLLTQSDATTAGTVIDSALEELGEIIAEVGSAQSRLDYAQNTLSNSIIYTDEARANLADTDIASESTAFALATVQQQAGIAVLAQTQALSSSLLDLLVA